MFLAPANPFDTPFCRSVFAAAPLIRIASVWLAAGPSRGVEEGARRESRHAPHFSGREPHA